MSPSPLQELSQLGQSVWVDFLSRHALQDGTIDRPQRCLWASTSVKDPRSPDTMYVEQLAGAETVNTMPPDTLAAVQDHGTTSGQTSDRDLEGAHRLFAALDTVGVDYDDVTATLEVEGVTKFADSFDQLFQNIKAKRDELATLSR